MHIDQSMLNAILVNKVSTFPQFYECAEFQMISLFEELYGADATTPINNIEDEKFFLNKVEQMLKALTVQVGFEVDALILEALSRHFMLHSVIPENEDNIVMRDYFNPMLMNHFNFYMYLSEYTYIYKDLLVLNSKQEFAAYMQQVAQLTNALIIYPLNQGSVELIVSKLVADCADDFEFGKEPSKKAVFQKFRADECKKDFGMNYYCVPSEYQRFVLQRATKSNEWIQEQIIKDKVAIKDVNQLTMRYYQYRFLENEYFKMDYKLRCSVPAHLRHAIHSTVADLLIVKGSHTQTILPADSFSSVKAPEIFAWLDLRMDGEIWLNAYKNRNSPIFKDLVKIKMLEMNLMRDQSWDSKLMSKRIKDAITHTNQDVKKRIKFREENLSSCAFRFK